MTAPRWPVWTFAGGAVAACAALAFAVLRYPGVFGDPEVTAWTVILVVVTSAYLVTAVVCLLRPASSGTVTGAWFGLAAGVAWLGEIVAQAPAHLPASLERPAGGSFALVAAGVTIAAGIVEGARTHSRARAWWAGLWAGLVSGTVATVGFVAVQLSNIGLLSGRADYRAEFAHSGYADIATYLASDAVAASLMHMILNVLLGLIGAGIGIAAGARLAAPRHP